MGDGHERDDFIGWIPQSEAAAIVGVSRRTLSRWALHLPKKRLGGRANNAVVFYRQVDIERLRVMRQGQRCYTIQHENAEKMMAVLDMQEFDEQVLAQKVVTLCQAYEKLAFAKSFGVQS
jgi:hypothetical protein